MAAEPTAGDGRTEIEAILASDLPEATKVARAFEAITGIVLTHTEREIDLARAMGDASEVVKQQIKRETMKAARQILQGCHCRVTGKRGWDEPA
jgi:CHASE3 domain sensor protein